jgi:hypothetical protein
MGPDPYILNGTTTQPSANFSISGTGAANILNIETQLNARGLRAFMIGFANSSGFGGGHTFAGIGAGADNYSDTIGNSFFGAEAGADNTSGGMNSFFGFSSGEKNTSGSSNSFFGRQSGGKNTQGFGNSFFGSGAGYTNVGGNYNTAIGEDTDLASGNLSYATAIGAGSVASLSNSIYLGRANGADAVRIPGAVIIDGSLVVHTMGSAGATQLCRNSADRISPCSSSLRYKTNIGGFNFGLDLIKRLRPITFDWKDGGMHDLGLGAEDVAAIEPLLVTYTKDGQVEGVKYDRIGVVLINAVKEQQAQIELQQKQIEEQRKEITVLKAALCNANARLEFCAK